MDTKLLVKLRDDVESVYRSGDYYLDRMKRARGVMYCGIYVILAMALITGTIIIKGGVLCILAYIFLFVTMICLLAGIGASYNEAKEDASVNVKLMKLYKDLLERVNMEIAAEWNRTHDGNKLEELDAKIRKLKDEIRRTEPLVYSPLGDKTQKPYFDELNQQMEAVEGFMKGQKRISEQTDSVLVERMSGGVYGVVRYVVQNTDAVLNQLIVCGRTSITEEARKDIEEKLASSQEYIGYARDMLVVTTRYITSDADDAEMDDASMMIYIETLRKKLDQKRIIQEFWDFT